MDFIVYEYTPIFREVNNFCDFLLASKMGSNQNLTLLKRETNIMVTQLLPLSV